MDDTADSLNLVKFAFWSVIAIIYFFVLRFNFPDWLWYFPPSIVHIAFIIFFLSFGKSIIWRSRYLAPQVTVNGCHGSIRAVPEYIPDKSMGKGLDGNVFKWAVFNLGYSHFPPLRGKLKTLVVPADQLKRVGDSFNGMTLVSLRPLTSLPSPVTAYFREAVGEYNLDSIYYGKYSQHYQDTSGIEADLSAQIDSLNAHIDQLTRINRNKFGGFEELKELADRMNSGGGTLKKFFSKAFSKEEEE